jgi:hypothetical protein
MLFEFKHPSAVREFWGARTASVLVSAFCRNELLFEFRQSSKEVDTQSSWKPGGFRQHATSVRSPDNRSPLTFRSLFERMKSKQPTRSFPFLQVNQREPKPRTHGLTEIRGPYYSVVGRRYLEDLFELMGEYVDSLKFAGSSFSLMPETAVRNLIELCHHHNVLVSTGGFLEHVLAQESDTVRQYVAECKRLGFDIIEISAGFISLRPMTGCGLSSWSANPD